MSKKKDNGFKENKKLSKKELLYLIESREEEIKWLEKQNKHLMEMVYEGKHQSTAKEISDTIGTIWRERSHYDAYEEVMHRKSIWKELTYTEDDINNELKKRKENNNGE